MYDRHDLSIDVGPVCPTKDQTQGSGTSAPARARSRPMDFMRNALMLLAAAVAISGCTLDHEKLEKQIKKKLVDEGLQIESISCPKARTIKEDDEFTCEGKEEDGVD